MNTILVTGGYGFLGRAIARKFKRLKYRVVGIGRGHWAPEDAHIRGFDVWLNAGVTLPGLMTLKEDFDLIVHCAGNGSVGYSLTNPLQDFNKTVQSTAEVLEYMRITGSKALLIYPSSAGVYGAKPDVPIQETDELSPISPYGFDKRIAEELLASYSRSYGIAVAIIRFFSIYGPGLSKQLLWDACARILAAGSEPVTFWGTGEETRDWIYSDDAAELIYTVSKGEHTYSILNGASGIRTTVAQTLHQLSKALGSVRELRFNNVVREGDPRHYHADVSRSAALGWTPRVGFPAGVDLYVKWLLAHGSAAD